MKQFYLLLVVIALLIPVLGLTQTEEKPDASGSDTVIKWQLAIDPVVEMRKAAQAARAAELRRKASGAKAEAQTLRAELASCQEGADTLRSMLYYDEHSGSTWKKAYGELGVRFRAELASKGRDLDTMWRDLDRVETNYATISREVLALRDERERSRSGYKKRSWGLWAAQLFVAGAATFLSDEPLVIGSIETGILGFQALSQVKGWHFSEPFAEDAYNVLQITNLAFTAGVMGHNIKLSKVDGSTF